MARNSIRKRIQDRLLAHGLPEPVARKLSGIARKALSDELRERRQKAMSEALPSGDAHADKEETPPLG